MGPIGLPETSVQNYHSMLRNIPEECRSCVHCGGSLKSRVSSASELCLPTAATIQLCLYLRPLHTHRTCSKQPLNFSPLGYAQYDRVITVRFSARVDFFLSAAGRPTLGPIRPPTFVGKGRILKLTTVLRLLPRLKTLGVYFHFPIRLHTGMLS
jgi:hypothetical protein